MPTSSVGRLLPTPALFKTAAMNPSEKSGAAAIVLMGGQSKRMGQPKAWLPCGDEVLVQRIVRVVGQVCQPVVVVAAVGQAVPEFPIQVQIVRDRFPNTGPLGGIATGLATLGGHATHAFVTSCDVPLLCTTFVAGICNAIGDAEIALPCTEGQLHPLAGCYALSVLPTCEALLGEGNFRPRALLQHHNALVLDADRLQAFDPQLLSLRNANTPMEYEECLALLHAQN